MHSTSPAGERWGAFKKHYPMYSGTDLMALALEEFMKKYDGSLDSYS